ncbi:hypothetical protein [Cryobacterium cryoconiti]|uniref:Uncharacterized protein n=1 Tax=Cryobacterium cryoconiti TaxID=1259239 RepID=A0A4Y8JSK6_9MICO|nr:hypothetical protein [Cryobacterium cryoconiti]TFD27496.1 hypothetical protein E3T49_13215 [Cryobacterium cryoconiti]
MTTRLPAEVVPGARLQTAIATAEGKAQAAAHRQASAEHRLRNVLADLDLIQAAANRTLRSLAAVRTNLQEPYPTQPGMTPWLHYIADARTELREATLTAERRLRRYNHTPTEPSTPTPEIPDTTPALAEATTA